MKKDGILCYCSESKDLRKGRRMMDNAGRLRVTVSTAIGNLPYWIFPSPLTEASKRMRIKLLALFNLALGDPLRAESCFRSFLAGGGTMDVLSPPIREQLLAFVNKIHHCHNASCRSILTIFNFVKVERYVDGRAVCAFYCSPQCMGILTSDIEDASHRSTTPAFSGRKKDNKGLEGVKWIPRKRISRNRPAPSPASISPPISQPVQTVPEVQDTSSVEPEEFAGDTAGEKSEILHTMLDNLELPDGNTQEANQEAEAGKETLLSDTVTVPTVSVELEDDSAKTTIADDTDDDSSAPQRTEKKGKKRSGKKRNGAHELDPLQGPNFPIPSSRWGKPLQRPQKILKRRLDPLQGPNFIIPPSRWGKALS